MKDVLLDWVAWKCGYGPGMNLLTVNDRKFRPEMLAEGLIVARRTTTPMAFLVEQGEALRGGPEPPTCISRLPRALERAGIQVPSPLST